MPAMFIQRSTTRRAEAVRRLVAQLAVAPARDLALVHHRTGGDGARRQFKHRGKWRCKSVT
jgi:hypothetical protein